MKGKIFVGLICLIILVIACTTPELAKLHEGVLKSADFIKPGFPGFLGEPRWKLVFEDGTEILWIAPGNRMWKIGKTYEVYGLNEDRVKVVHLKGE